MGKIRKPAPSHSEITLSPALQQFLDGCTHLPLHQLPPHLGTFPAEWPFPRGDLFNWVTVLDRFDDILENFNKTYGLSEGPQSQPFGRKLLLEKPEIGDATEEATLDQAGFSQEGDRELIEHILGFSRLLFENCANRRLYASSYHIDALFNTTSISLLNSALRLALRLAQKYACDRVRQSGGHRDGLFLTSLSHSTLAIHYQISLDKLYKLSLPFRKSLSSPSKRAKDIKETEQGLHVTPTYSAEPLSLLSDEESEDKRRELYGQPYFSLRIDPKNADSGDPGTSHQGPQSGQNPAAVNGSTPKSNDDKKKSARFELIEVPTNKLLEMPLHEIVAEYMPKFPKACQYEFLCRLRVSKALCGTVTDRTSIINSRLLAVSNYLNIFPEGQHQIHSKIFQTETDDTRHAKLSSQMCDILHPSPGKSQLVPRQLQTTALTILEGYMNHPKKSTEAIAALGANVNHGILTYIIRKEIQDLSEINEAPSVEEREWSKALFSLLHSLPKAIPRTAEGILATRALDSFVEALRLRTPRAEIAFPQILTTIDLFVFNIRNAFNHVVDAGGADTLADLFQHEIDQALYTMVDGRSVPEEWRSGVVDYRVGLLPQSTLRGIFKLLKNMLQATAGALDRNLRNLIETTQLLSGLRCVIDYPSIFGSNIWCGAVEIFSHFIHNEPTSYAALAEAGLTTAFLGVVTGSRDSKSLPSVLQDSSSGIQKELSIQSPPITLEGIASVPLAFSAICLNENGMRQFVDSQALSTFFKNLLTPAYCKALSVALDDHRTRRVDVESLGAAFDELARHHPSLKPDIIRNFVSMLDTLHDDLTNPRTQQRANNSRLDVSLTSPAHDTMLSPLAAPLQSGNDLEMPDADSIQDKNVDDDTNGEVNLIRMKVVSEILSGFFTNTSFCASFAEHGGVEKLVDILCAPVYPFYPLINISQPGFARVVSVFIGQKPHLILPLLFERLRSATKLCRPFANKDDNTLYLAQYAKKKDGSQSSSGPELACLNGMTIIRNILSLLTPLLSEPSSRHAQNPMASINVADGIIALVPQLTLITRSCILEHALLQDQTPAQVVDSDAASGTALDVAQNSESCHTANGTGPSTLSEPSTEPRPSTLANDEVAKPEQRKDAAENDRQGYNKVTDILKNLPLEICFFLHSIGKCVALSRRLPSDSFQRAKALAVSASIAQALVSLLDQPLPSSFTVKIADYVRCNLLMATIAALVEKRSDSASQFLTIVIWHFKKAGGIEAMIQFANSFFFNSELPGKEDSDAKLHEATWAFQGLRTLFGFFMRATSQRSVHESNQTVAMQSRAERERDRPDHFSEAQFLVEMRYHALRLIQPMWGSDNLAKLSRDLVKHVCTILQHSLEASGESGALKRAEKIRDRTSSPAKKWRLRNEDSLKALTDKGHTEALAREALYRCTGSLSAAQEYCDIRARNPRLPHFAIPADDISHPPTEDDPEATATDPQTTDHQGSTVNAEDESSRQESHELVSRLLEAPDPSSMEVDFAEGAEANRLADQTGQALIDSADVPSEPGAVEMEKSVEEASVVPVETLEELRKAFRDDLVDRCLFVLDSFDTLSFELADLITASVAKATSPEAKMAKADIAKTLLHSLLSYQGSDDLKQLSGKVASSALLLGVIFQDKDFLDNARDDLTDNVESLTQFLIVPQESQSTTTLTWMSNILLILEKTLCEDLQPIALEKSSPENLIIAYPVPLVTKESKKEVFTVVANLLPKVGKDHVLATACLRVLIALTRDPTIAALMAEKRKLQRLFLLIKQLSTVKEAKVMPLLLVILRHLVEYPDTIRKSMRSEIEAYFVKNARQSPTVSTYTRQLFHLSLRSPEIFVDVTNDIVALARVHGSAASSENTLVLKRDLPPMEQMDGEDTPPKVEDTSSKEGPIADTEATDAQPSTEQPATDEGHQLSENKVPHLARADGVTAFLLSELLAYKDVHDKDSSAPSNGETKILDQNDVEMTNGAQLTLNSQTPTDSGSLTQPSNEKMGFKLDDHIVFMYRCILMQCLTELLQSYGLTKLNFLAFSRKADPLATGPLKPRSGVLNYLLHQLIADSPVSEGHEIQLKKHNATSNWAANVLTALCARTQEKFVQPQPDSSEMDDDQDLAFVRRFVLEHALKNYKDTAVSTELPKESKYARLYSLAELFNRMLSGKPTSNPLSVENAREPRVVDIQKSMAKIMFEKHSIPLLTTSVSDLDQHTPDANKALRCVLKVLKTLTHTAIHLSETGNIKASDEQEDGDEISSASSTSELAEGREETPDLFRNSTLGMFEPGREDGSSSEDSEGEDAEDDIYGDDYADDMEFDEQDPDQADGEVVSDDEEVDATDGMGPVEGLPGDVPMEVDIDIEEEEEADDGSDQDDASSERSASSEDEDEDAHDAEVEIMEDIEGDEQSESVEEEDPEDGEEWQDEDEEAIDFGEHTHLPPGLAAMARSGAESPSDNDIEVPIPEPDADAIDPGTLGGFDADDIHEDPEDHDSEDEDREMDEDEDDYDEDEMVFGRHDLDDDDLDLPSPMPWRQWPTGPSRRHHHQTHHHHHRHMHSLFPDMDAMFMPEVRSHRTGGPRTPDDSQGVNPLLNRNRREQDQAPSSLPRPPRAGAVPPFNAASLLASIGRHFPEDAFGLDRQALDHILQTLGQGGAFSIQMHGTDPRSVPVHGMRSLLENGPFRSSPPTIEREDPFQSIVFEPASTKLRWEESARILFGPDFVAKSNKLVESLLKVLTPPALEREKRLQAKREEQERKFEEEQAKMRAKQTEEREAREKKEREEREAREADEAAEREAAEADAARAAAENEAAQDEPTADNSAPTDAMEGVQSAENEETSPAAGPSEAAEPVVTSIRGREVNITHLGIDTAYLEALPEELREEVIMQQAAEHRSTQPAPQEGQGPSTIDSDFLAALPSDIREEILQQEAADRRRREREDARQRARDNGAPAQPEDIDPASLLASLDPMLRQQVLAESDEDMLAALPPDIQAEARALGGHRRRAAVPPSILGRAGGLPFGASGSGRDPSSHARHEVDKRQRTPIVQMLDKAGIAGLLRLMFVSLHPQLRGTLNSVLLNVCGNRQTRSEVVNGLLSILQDGSADVDAVERCFGQLTLKAKQQPLPKTPQKTTTTSTRLHSDVSPNVVMEQSITALNFLAASIGHIPHFFVTEHDAVGAVKGKTHRKGKGKDTKASRYPFMVLVGLLEREVVINNTTNLDLLSGLLAQITQPLNNIAKKDGGDKKDEKQPTTPPNQQPEAQATPQLSEQSSEQVSQEPTSAAVAPSNDQTLAMQDVVDVTALTSAVSDAANSPQEISQSANEGESSKLPEEPKPAKKLRTLSPPDVSPELLKPLVNMIMSRECNSKVFQNAIATMSSLAVVNGARDVFKHELIEQARSLAQVLQARLASLTKPLKAAENEIDAQSHASAELSPTGSDQTKFHRILTALDYLFQSQAKKKAAEKDKGSADSKDELIGLYEEASFMSIWNRLSDVLNAIKRSDSTFFLNVATILLSLIESLMLVCKRITLTDSASSRKQPDPSTEPKDMPLVFFNFTNQHRKILNELVRQNPKLMSNNFSVLVKNPGILEFDNKRSYFSRRLHHRTGDMRHYPHPSLQLHVRRDQVFLDSYKHLYYKSPQEIKYGKFNIRFHNEEGVDAGGVTREWFQVLAKQMFNADYALFNPVASDRTTFHPNALSWVNPEHLSFFKFIGRIIGKALYENRVLDCHFSRAVYKKILGQPVSIRDMESVDLDYSKNMEWVLSNDITDIITETFSVTVDKFGVEEVIDLIPNGRNIPVTEENKEEYVRKVIEYRLTGSVSEQLESFLQGFYDIVPTELISIFDEGELELLISGMPDVDVDDWRANTDYHNYNASSPQIQWFWRAVRSFGKEERARLLQFVTGTGKVPLNGFKELEGMNGFTRFSIHKDFGSRERLPSSHTCFNQLDLPEYDSYEQLRKGLYTAMTTGNEHFGFA